jgi:hypothetical protein
MAASNTKECFRECIGKKIVGVLFDTLPVGRRDLAVGTYTLVFDDGSGLTFKHNGAFWQESKEEIRQGIDNAKENLKHATTELEGVLEVAGVFSSLKQKVK